MAFGRTAAELNAGIAAEKAAKLAESDSWDRFLDRAANTNLRRREGDSMDAYRRGEIDVRRLDTTGMNSYRRALTDNDLSRIQSGERLGTLQTNNQYNLGLDTNRTAVTNTDRSSTANENMAGFGAVASMRNAEIMADAAKQPTWVQRMIYNSKGVEGLMPTDPNVKALQAANQNDQATAYRNLYQAKIDEYNKQFNSDQRLWNPDDLTTEAIDARMDQIVKDRKLDPKNRMSVYNEALAGVAADSVNQLYPQFAGQSIGQPVVPSAPPAPVAPQPQSMNGGSTNNMGDTWLQMPGGDRFRITTIK